MALRKQLTAVLLVFAFSAAPELLWLGAHALSHHEHAGEEAGHHADLPEHAAALVHGHQHAEGEPEHEHNLVPPPPLRQGPPRDVQTPAIASLGDPYAAPLPAGTPPLAGRIQLSGASPPLLHLHCALLI